MCECVCVCVSVSVCVSVCVCVCVCVCVLVFNMSPIYSHHKLSINHKISLYTNLHKIKHTQTSNTNIKHKIFEELVPVVLSLLKKKRTIE